MGLGAISDFLLAFLVNLLVESCQRASENFLPPKNFCQVPHLFCLQEAYREKVNGETNRKLQVQQASKWLLQGAGMSEGVWEGEGLQVRNYI